METQGIPVCGIAANGCIEAVRERKWKCKESMLHRCQFPLEQTGGENQKPFFTVLKCINSCPADYRKCLTITNSYVTLKINSTIFTKYKKDIKTCIVLKTPRQQAWPPVKVMSDIALVVHKGLRK